MATEGKTAEVIKEGDCPFKVGEVVVYRPSERGIGLSVMIGPEGKPEIGQSVKVTRIVDGRYVVWEGFDHPSGGIYWTEFSRA